MDREGPIVIREAKENFEDRRKRRAQRGYHAEKKQNKAGIILALIVLVFAAPLIKDYLAEYWGFW